MTENSKIDDVDLHYDYLWLIFKINMLIFKLFRVYDEYNNKWIL